MYHIKIWFGTKVLVFSSRKKNVDLTVTSNSEQYLVDTNDDKDQNYQLSTTYDESNDETEDPIEPEKQSPRFAAQIEIDLFSSTDAVSIVVTKYTVFPSAKVPAILSSIYTSSKPSCITALPLVSKKAPVKIVIIAPI